MNTEAFVYEWTNTLGKRYIGYHLGSTNDGYITSSKSDEFWNDWKNPDVTWNRKIIAVGSKTDMLALERKLLKENKEEIFNGTTFYNNSTGGGVVFTNEVRQKISKKNKGKESPYKGKTSPKVCCVKCRKEISVYQTDKHYNSNSCRPKKKRTMTITEEAKRKISNSLLGKKKSKETREKMSIAFSGRTHSLETKEKIGAAAKLRNAGTVWITNGNENKRIKNVDIIPEGWYNGRTF